MTAVERRAAAPRRRPRSRSRATRRQRRTAGVALAAVSGIATLAHPTGVLVLDQLWCAALAAAGAYLGSYARRGPLLVALAAAALFAPDRLTMVPVILGLVATVASTSDLRRPAPFLRATGGGAAVCALLVASSYDRAASTSLLAWAVVLAPLLASSLSQLPTTVRRRVLIGAGATAAALAVAGMVAGLGALSARRQVDRGVAALDRGLAAARAGDVELARSQLAVASQALDIAANDIGTWGLASWVVPGAAQNVRAVAGVLDAAASAADRAEDAAGVIDDEALSVDGGALDLEAVAALVEPLEGLRTALESADGELRSAASEPLLPMVRSRLDRIGPDLRRALDDARTSAQAAAVVPEMLGADGPRRYLVLFTSPTEARGRFGFPASYAVVTAEAGRIELEVAQGIATLQGNTVADQSTMPVDQPDVAPYVAYGATANWRQVTVVPDFPTVATLARELWRQTGTGEIDGVLRLDTTALAALVGFTGPVRVEGRAAPLTADTLTQYLDFDQYVEFEDESSARRQDVLEELAGTVFDALLLADLPGPRGLADVLGPMVDQGHLNLAGFDSDAAALLDAIDLSGRFGPPTTPDALMVAGTNITGNKIDAFLRRTVDYQAVVLDDGTIDATARVTLANEAPADGLPAYVIGSALPAEDAPPPGTNKTVLLVWSPFPLAGATIDGTEVAATSNQTGGWWVHGIDVDVPPEGQAVVELRLNGAAAAPGRYELEVRPGGGARPDDLLVSVHDADGQSLVEERTSLGAVSRFGT